jgi:hypothetical protein
MIKRPCEIEDTTRIKLRELFWLSSNQGLFPNVCRPVLRHKVLQSDAVRRPVNTSNSSRYFEFLERHATLLRGEQLFPTQVDFRRRDRK